MKKAVKKRVGRPPGRKAPRRPVVSGRVPESLYEAIKESARASGRTVSEELIWRAEKSYEWEKAFGERAKWLAESRAKDAELEADDVEVALERRGWLRVTGAEFGYANWISPDNHSFPHNLDLTDPAAEAARKEQIRQLGQLESALERVVVRAMKAALEERGYSK